MIDIEKLKKVILVYLNDVSVEDRFKCQICMKQSTSKLLTKFEIMDLDEFCYIETSRHLHITPYLLPDVICVNTDKINKIYKEFSIEKEG